MMMILTVKKVLLFVALFVFVSVAQAADFAGPGKCRGCHKDEYAGWKDSPHALAFSNGFQETWKDWEVNSPALFAMPPVQTQRPKPFHTPVSPVSPAMAL